MAVWTYSVNLIMNAHACQVHQFFEQLCNILLSYMYMYVYLYIVYATKSGFMCRNYMYM